MPNPVTSFVQNCRVTWVAGPRGSGKTLEILRRATDALAAGKQVLWVCATKEKIADVWQEGGVVSCLQPSGGFSTTQYGNLPLFVYNLHTNNPETQPAMTRLPYVCGLNLDSNQTLLLVDDTFLVGRVLSGLPDLVEAVLKDGNEVVVTMDDQWDVGLGLQQCVDAIIPKEGQRRCYPNSAARIQG